jgi:hypothetical protein
MSTSPRIGQRDSEVRDMLKLKASTETIMAKRALMVLRLP